MASRPWTLAQAYEHLAKWLQAEDDVTTGQSYTIGDRSLTRVHPTEIRKQIAFWRKEIAELEGRGSRIFSAIPKG